MYFVHNIHKPQIDPYHSTIKSLQQQHQREINALKQELSALQALNEQFQEAITAVKGYDDKIRVVLNKSDQVNTQQLMRVYGALMWSLGKVIHTPEVARVYIGSFWDQPFLYADNRALFEAEASDLIGDLQTLPDNAALRKINDLIKRARLAKVRFIILSIQSLLY